MYERIGIAWLGSGIWKLKGFDVGTGLDWTGLDWESCSLCRQEENELRILVKYVERTLFE